jgi:hypothetical protein
MPKAQMMQPETRLRARATADPTRDCSELAPLLSMSHQSAEPMNTPLTHAPAVR